MQSVCVSFCVCVPPHTESQQLERFISMFDSLDAHMAWHISSRGRFAFKVVELEGEGSRSPYESSSCPVSDFRLFRRMWLHF
uniref:Putative secreted protein n=1 Tax=Anopheles marajoara TaxID=58244 RepID=A0A2M4CB86_9DIPT